MPRVKLDGSLKRIAASVLPLRSSPGVILLNYTCMCMSWCAHRFYRFSRSFGEESSGEIVGFAMVHALCNCNSYLNGTDCMDILKFLPEARIARGYCS